jgi:lipoprotein-anchoring transpeptidase ErfK/SrfK
MAGRRAPAAAAMVVALAGCGAEADAPSRRPAVAFETTAFETAPAAASRRPAGRFLTAPAAASRRPAGRFLTARVTSRRPAGRFLTARVVRRTALRARPGGRVVARIGRRTEYGSRRVLAVTGRRGGWLRVIASERANGRSAWIRASAARLGATDLWLRVDRSRRRLTLRRGHRVLRRLPVAVGRPGTPTPLGRFAVTDLLRLGRGSPYGCCALALSGHQANLLPGWRGGDRLAIHGTPNPETVGRAASLGCLRAHAADLRALLRTVPLGAPVVVVR